MAMSTPTNALHLSITVRLSRLFAHLSLADFARYSGTIDKNGLNNPRAPLYIVSGNAGHYDVRLSASALAFESDTNDTSHFRRASTVSTIPSNERTDLSSAPITRTAGEDCRSSTQIISNMSTSPLPTLP